MRAPRHGPHHRRRTPRKPATLPAGWLLGTHRCLQLGKAPLFRWLQKAGDIPERDLWHTFNLGIGFCLVVPAGIEAAVIEHCHGKNHPAWVIGHVTSNTPDSASILEGVPA